MLCSVEYGSECRNVSKQFLRMCSKHVRTLDVCRSTRNFFGRERSNGSWPDKIDCNTWIELDGPAVTEGKRSLRETWHAAMLRSFSALKIRQSQSLADASPFRVLQGYE